METTIIKKQKSDIKMFMFICFMASLSLTLIAQSNVSTDSIIPKEIITHKIVNKELKNLISEYDNTYSKYRDDPSMGISVYCYISLYRVRPFARLKNKITFSIGYMFDIGNKSNLIVCEPINGKEVSIVVQDLYNYITLPMEHSVELLKNSNLKQYQSIKESLKKHGNSYRYFSTSSFVWWEITFDKQSGKLLKKYTPDRTEEYEKNKGRF